MKAHKIVNLTNGKFKTSSWYGESETGELFHKPGAVKRWLNSNLNSEENLEVIEYELKEVKRIPAQLFKAELNLKKIKRKANWPQEAKYILTGIFAPLKTYLITELPDWDDRVSLWVIKNGTAITEIDFHGIPGELRAIV
jgi:hypothetical protein